MLTLYRYVERSKTSPIRWISKATEAAGNNPAAVAGYGEFDASADLCLDVQGQPVILDLHGKGRDRMA
ncbi:MAG: hypothetical protein ACLSA6_01600 [Holdemania massiliensis]